ncbi:MAG TPA: outer membrane beta-barrel protein [Terracidiphilus sp.]|nr:outer membrane beta-barrel protein [Terracidiphilus sp.]
MRRSACVVLSLMMCAGATLARAQVQPTAKRGTLSVRVGAMGSGFQPDYAGGGIAQASPYRLFGAGAYVDVRLRRWVQLEAEGRWLRFHQYINIYQDNYLIGPRVPIHTFLGRVTPYGKVLFGFTHMNFEYNETDCRCQTIAYGGGADVKLDNRWTLRAVDFEYQQLPNWYQLQNSQLHPYGVSVGISYRIF